MTLRRLDWPPFFLGGMVFFGYVGAMVYDWPVPLGALILTGTTVAGVLIFLYLDGPAVSLTVRPDRVVVCNTFLRYDVPRHQIDRLDELVGYSLKLRLRNGRRIALRVWEPALVRPVARRPSRHDQRTHTIAQLLTDVPAVASSGEVDRHWRYGHLALALAPFVVFGITAAVLLSQRS
jgi:hypothetical protein